MTRFLWELPLRGDGRRADPARWQRNGFEHLHQVIDAAELAGLDGVVAPYDPDGEESWIVAGGALRHTRHSRVIVEFHPAFGTPVYAAKLSLTLQRLGADRLDWLLHVDTTTQDARQRGDRVTGTARYERAAEFLTVARGVWSGRGALRGGFDGGEFHHDGTYFDVVAGGFDEAVDGHPFPTVHLTGTSPEAIALSAEHGDVHLFTESTNSLAAQVAALRDAATARDRAVGAGLVLPVIAREDEDEARARLLRLWRETDPSATEPEVLARFIDDLRFDGFDHIGHRVPVGLVGSYDQVAERLAAYERSGITTFVLSGHPSIEEIHRAGEHLLHLADPAGRTLTGASA
ncbi:LLM class flavin-dependent oxidoreductase [Amycolatopsis sp. EV170708-02-1]|uniref:LLM class flavin-dependent oxidoreductase n=1 Tax=Amycolatopsis sp. EV170708-02-1 TaxID=2919322 RepID=UPI001F0C3C0D|nr:LLM class flavin-dependent oxidoreductase [Amycolatopsis sp. EV170708-02-1]UMP07039.1 LLM class flavin-dependent oxidoreductase [Amycolatopsis sp. EV170708-02-1]